MSRTPKLALAVVLLAAYALTGTFSAQAKQDHSKPEDQFNSGMPLSALDKKHLLEDNFVLVKTVAAIPVVVQKKILGDGGRESMADAGQPFRRTDVLDSKPLPSRRLIFAGTSLGYCFVYNEHGVFGYWTQVSLYRLSAGQAILVWLGTPHNGNMDMLNLPQLRDAISKGKFDSVPLLEQPKHS